MKPKYDLVIAVTMLQNVQDVIEEHIKARKDGEALDLLRLAYMTIDTVIKTLELVP